MATDWPKQTSRFPTLIRAIFFIIPEANPGYNSKMHLIKQWLIEFEEVDGELYPWREIALDENGDPLFDGPDNTNYGFWLDTNMKYQDFEGEPIDKGEFEKMWELTGIEDL